MHLFKDGEQMKKVIIYGAGAMGIAMQNLLKKKDINILCILDKNVQLCGSKIKGIEVITPNLIKNEHYKYDIIVSVSACPYFIIKEYLKNIGFTSIYSAVDFINMLYGSEQIVGVWNLSEIDLENLNTFTFDDEISTNHFNIAKEWFANRQELLYKNNPISIDREKYFPDFIRTLLNREDIYVDTGILKGEFVEKFLLYSRAKCVYAFSLSPESVPISILKSKKELKGTVFLKGELSDKKNKSEILRMGIMEPFTSNDLIIIDTDTMDNVFINKKFTYLRIYSMSEAKKIIMGGLKTIQVNRPIISINISHYREDFIGVLPLLKNILSKYSFYFRMHSFQGNDCIIYAIPKERMMKKYEDTTY